MRYICLVPQLHLYVPDEVARQVRLRAEARGLSVSAYLLERAGTPIGPNDLLTAATARAHGVVLVSHNTKEFGRVAGLRLDDWEGG